MGFGAAAVAIVEHRIDELLEGEGIFAAVARQQRQRRGKAAARAFAHHADPGRIETLFGGVGEDPGKAGIAVLDRAGKHGLGREPIVDRDDRAVQLDRQRPVGHVPLIRGAGDKAAAMDVIDDGKRGGGRVLRSQDAQLDVGAPRRAGDGLHLDRRVGLRRRQHRPQLLAQRRQAFAAELAVRKLLQNGQEFGVDEVAAVHGQILSSGHDGGPDGTGPSFKAGISCRG